MIDIYIATHENRFQGFIPNNAIWRGGPSKERIAEINEEFPICGDGWIYRRTSAGVVRWHRWKKW